MATLTPARFSIGKSFSPSPIARACSHLAQRGSVAFDSIEISFCAAHGGRGEKERGGEGEEEERRWEREWVF
jgi:hypothetical protein